MRPKKSLILHNPRLIKIRKNLRALLEQSYLSELSDLTHQSNIYRKMRQEGKLGNYSSDEEKQLTRKESNLMQTYSQSILVCNLGASCISQRDKSKEQIYNNKLERNMVWAPWLGGWICLDCYNYFCIQQYHFDIKERDYDEERRLLDFLKKHGALTEK